MRFTKMHGAGNDFILLETSDVQRDWSQVAVSLCNRHYGIGADGFLLLLPSQVADFRMRIFNPDGSEAAACGNGLRCLVRYFAEKNQYNVGTRQKAREISVETVAGIRIARVFKTAGTVSKIQTAMGRPGIGNNNSPAVLQSREDNIVDIKKSMDYILSVDSKKLQVYLVSVGNSHAVHFYNGNISDFPLSHLGPKVEKYRAFPNKVNFEVARVIDRKKIEARVWESGVGETLACGSGACAITVAAQLLGYVDSKVKVKLPGGILEVEWDGAGEIFLSGPAETVFTGEWPD
jgi:diaminopimelate epimerase